MKQLKLYFGLAKIDWLFLLVGVFGLCISSAPSYLIAADSGKLSDWIIALSTDSLIFVAMVLFCRDLTKKRVKSYTKR